MPEVLKNVKMCPIIANIERAMNDHKIRNKAALAHFVGLSRGQITKLFKVGSSAGGGTIAAFKTAFPGYSSEYFFTPIVIKK